MDAAIEANAAQLIRAGMTSAVSNRKALRVAEEPLPFSAATWRPMPGSRAAACMIRS